MRVAAITFDEATFLRINALAREAGTSFAEQARILIGRGLTAGDRP